MASRRAIISSALRASAAVHPVRPIFTVAARTARPSLAPQAFAPFARLRNYSAKRAPTQDYKKWEFEELKKLVENGTHDDIVIVGMRTPSIVSTTYTLTLRRRRPGTVRALRDGQDSWCDQHSHHNGSAELPYSRGGL
jgi:hypothetical protein